MMVEIVKEYGNEIPGIIKRLKDKHIDGNDKSEAEIIFSTVHRCKGMEYDSIHLVNDFITEEKIIQLKENSNQQFTIDKILEEINLLYVAITRTKNLLYIPEKLLPATFISAPNIHVLKMLTKQEKEQAKQVSKGVKKVHINQTENIQKAYSISDKRLTHKSAYNTWNESLDDELRTLFHRGISMPEMANYFGRTKGAIYSRIKKLGLLE
jgi:ATP-dependent exoDNAse (exonuclease V) beta subunit